MRAINRHLEEQTQKAKEIFRQHLEKACPLLKRDFKVTRDDGDIILFTIDGYVFSLTWADDVRQAIGRVVPAVSFQLSIWHQTPGGRWHPPEDVDTELLDTQSIHECIKCALETVAKDEIRQCLEGVGYEFMVEEKEEW